MSVFSRMKAMKLRALSLILMLVVALSGCTTTGDVDPADLDPGPRPTNTNQKVHAYLKNEIRNSDKFTDVDISEPKLGNRWVGLLTSGPRPEGQCPELVCVRELERKAVAVWPHREGPWPSFGSRTMPFSTGAMCTTPISALLTAKGGVVADLISLPTADGFQRPPLRQFLGWLECKGSLPHRERRIEELKASELSPADDRNGGSASKTSSTSHRRLGWWHLQSIAERRSLHFSADLLRRWPCFIIDL